MKKIFIATLVSALFFSLGCVELDVSPSSSIDKDNFYRTEADALAAVNGVYSILTNAQTEFFGLYSNSSIYLGDVITEYAKAGANTNSMFIREVSTADVQPSNTFMEGSWAESYIGINRANLVIDHLSDSDLSGNTKERLINEAKFLRALFYFNIVRWWGDAPLILREGEGEGAPREKRDLLYAQIAKDFEDAAALPDDASGRATGTAALAILSKVYLTWAQTDSERGKVEQAAFYKKSVEYADRVISSGKYSLVENVLDNFDVTKKNGIEHIFSIQHGEKDNVTGHCTFAMGWSDSEPVIMLNDLKFYDLFDDADQRKAGSYAKTLYNPAEDNFFTFKTPLFRKYIDTVNFAGDQYAGRNTNTVYIRYAEVLLIKAESENELNGATAQAYDAINQVRRRAYKQFPLTATSPYDLPGGLSKDQFREKLQEERFLEFVLEGHHWFDLVRWHKLVKTVKPYKPAVSLRNYLFPLPADQIRLNPNLTQNWGYDSEEGTNPYSGYEQ
ncbi:SusD family protein [Bacteroidales bacterium Barb4]|nr:SusD family protein [Bacteroidales bacterium Barb4]